MCLINFEPINLQGTTLKETVFANDQLDGDAAFKADPKMKKKWFGCFNFSRDSVKTKDKGLNALVFKIESSALERSS